MLNNLKFFNRNSHKNSREITHKPVLQRINDPVESN